MVLEGLKTTDQNQLTTHCTGKWSICLEKRLSIKSLVSIEFRNLRIRELP